MAYERVNWENLPSKNTPVNADNLNKMDEGIANAVEKSDLLNLIYPVGSIYMSVNSTSPATLFGGTWKQIKGRFLLGTGSIESNNNEHFGQVTAGEINAPVGEKGGEASHKLTINEMPKHTHDIKSNATDGSLGWTIKDHQANAQLEDLKWQWGGRSVSYAGGSQQHNNMPPYLAVYMWKRIS